jgi:hypothetical protein
MNRRGMYVGWRHSSTAGGTLELRTDLSHNGLSNEYYGSTVFLRDGN